MRTICIVNQKGGVGKTTTSVNLASALASLKKRVLLIDLDPQGNASSGLGIKRHEYHDRNVYHVLIGANKASEAIYQTKNPYLSLMPANSDLVGAEIELVDEAQREFRMKKALEEIQDKFDYVLIDCPPSLSLLTVNALTSANTFLVPLQCEYYALEGLSQLLNTAGIIKKKLNPQLKIEGILLTMFDTRNNLSHQVVQEIQNHFKDKVFSAVIPRNVRLSEAPSHGVSIFEYDDKSVGARKYLELAVELDTRAQLDQTKTEEPAKEEVPPQGASAYDDANTEVTDETIDNDVEAEMSSDVEGESNESTTTSGEVNA